jgi:hypothetical protein
MKYSISAFILILFCSMISLAQGICVPDTFKVSMVKGKVMAHLEKRDEPLHKISLRIYKQYKLKKAVYQVTSNQIGEFEFDKLKPGKYTLKASYKGLNDFYLDLIVASAKSPSTNQTLIVWMGADFLKPCSGSYAELK